MFLVVAAESFFHFNTTVRTILIILLITISLFLITYNILLPLIKKVNFLYKTNYELTANKVGRLFPTIKDELQNVLQLINNSRQIFYSKELLDAAFSVLFEKTRLINFDSALNFDKPKKLLVFSIPISIITLILIFSIPSFNEAGFRLIHFNSDFIPPQKFIFVVAPGDTKITKGENVTIKITTKGASPAVINLFIKDETQTNFELKKIYIDSNNAFIHELIQVRNSTNYYAESDGIISNEFRISVIDRPIIQSLNLKIVPPFYTKLPTQEQKDNGNIAALYGSSVNFAVLANKELKNGYLFFNDSTKIKMNIRSNYAQINFDVREEKNYQIIMEDFDGNANLSPIVYSIKLTFDTFPTIDILSPNKNVNMPGDQRLALFVKISDDYGFSKLYLKYRLSSSKYEPVHDEYSVVEIPINSLIKEQEVNYIWNLSMLDLATEDVITYYLEVLDNDNISGPKVTKSSTFTIRIPSLDELFETADDKQKDLESDLLKTLKEAEELKKDLEKIDQELKSDKKEISWEEKEKLEKALDKFEQLQNKVDEIQSKLEDTRKELQDNNLLSKETLEKYLELQKLFSELTNDEMKKAMEQLQNVLKNLDRKEIQNQVQNMNMNEEMFKKSLERTLNLMKRIQVEQKIDELIKRTEELEKKQADLNKQTENADLQNKNQREDLAKKQDDISKELKQLEDEMKELKDKMKDLDDVPKDELDNAMKEFDQQENHDKSQDASDNISEMKKQDAGEMQKQLSKNMKKMKQNFSSMQQKMQQENQLKTFNEMFKILSDIINLSKKQENLKNKTQNNRVGKSFNEDAKQQDAIKRNLQKIMSQLSSLSQKTFAITPEMGKALGDAMQNMDKAIQELQNRNLGLSISNETEAMASLNEAATLMKSMMDAMSQNGGQGSGMMSLLQQLGQMSGQQMSLNNLTQQLKGQGQGQGKLSPEQLSQLQRLSQQQELIRKSLEQLNKEAKIAGQSKTLPTNINDILKQMEEVVTDMKTEKLDDQLIQKQERILSKLLDAQKSINERDFEKERKSNTGENVVRQSPNKLDLQKQNKSKLIDELNKSINEGYLKDYENLIKKYYEQLQKEIKN
jgi:hypothetical protein